MLHRLRGAGRPVCGPSQGQPTMAHGGYPLRPCLFRSLHEPPPRTGNAAYAVYIAG
jgi:hypothetical protein